MKRYVDIDEIVEYKLEEEDEEFELFNALMQDTGIPYENIKIINDNE